MDVGRDAAAVVAHRAGPIRIERDRNFGGKPCERFVDGVIDDLVDHVVQAGAVVGIADIHARPLAHGVEAFEDLDRFGVIFGRVFAGRFSHQGTFKTGRKMSRNGRFV